MGELERSFSIVSSEIPEEELPLHQFVSRIAHDVVAAQRDTGSQAFLGRTAQSFRFLIDPQGEVTKLTLQSEQRILRGTGGILGRAALINLIESGQLIVDPLAEDFPHNIDPVSFDVDFGDTIKIVTGPIDTRRELSPQQVQTINLAEKGYYDLEPNGHILCAIKQRLRMPAGYYGEIWSKGSIARAGLSVNNSDPQIDPGFDGWLTLEAANHHNDVVRLYPGIPIARVQVYKVLGDGQAVYDGDYAHNPEPTTFRPA